MPFKAVPAAVCWVLTSLASATSRQTSASSLSLWVAYRKGRWQDRVGCEGQPLGSPHVPATGAVPALRVLCTRWQWVDIELQQMSAKWDRWHVSLLLTFLRSAEEVGQLGQGKGGSACLPLCTARNLLLACATERVAPVICQQTTLHLSMWWLWRRRGKYSRTCLMQGISCKQSPVSKEERCKGIIVCCMLPVHLLDHRKGVPVAKPLSAELGLDPRQMRTVLCKVKPLQNDSSAEKSQPADSKLESIFLWSRFRFPGEGLQYTGALALFNSQSTAWYYDVEYWWKPWNHDTGPAAARICCFFTRTQWK